MVMARMSGELFDQVADLYDRARPAYPEELFDELIQQAGLSESSRLLEIAPGTGQATLPLARRGYRIVAVELGKALSAIAKDNLDRYPHVKILSCAFEDVDLPDNSFDLVYVATAFHWIRPDKQFSKPHLLLNEGGHLAIIKSNHIASDAGNRLFDATQPIYRKYWPTDPGAACLTALDEVAAPTFDEGLFKLAAFKCFPQTISYDTMAYCDLLSTESDKLALTVEKREGFLQEIRELVNERFSGIAERRYTNSLLILKRRN